MVSRAKHKSPNKGRDSTRCANPKDYGRSAVTNGSSLLPHVDGRSIWVRRFRDLIHLHLSDLGGEATASEAEKALVRRAACLVVELEQMEQRFAQEGAASPSQLECYQRCANTLRRLLQAIGLDRRPKDITPPDGTGAIIAHIRGTTI